MTYAVIMAGGIGSRFWPMSRKETPKQFIQVVQENTLIQNTVARLQGVIPPERIFIVTHARYVQQTHEQLPAIPFENILAEPVARNTAPCITYAAHRLHQLDSDATMVVLPADHVIQNVKKFHDVLHRGINAAQRDLALVTIGIHPTYPATGYGYVQYEGAGDHETDDVQAYPVKTFAEKPDLATAERFMDSGDFLWNSGMFIWRTESILSAIKEYIPDVYDAFEAIENQFGTENDEKEVAKAYAICPSISVDYGVMERSKNVFVIPGDFDWNDVGDWKAVYDLHEKNSSGNVILGNAIAQDARNCMIHANNRLIVVVGMDDTIVVDTEDATLICHQERTQQVKNVVDFLNAEQLESFV
jgi:mannose-1-phosphate guanylyltransferase